MAANRFMLHAFCAALALCAPAHAETITIAATVNDEVITSVDVAERRALVMAMSGIPAGEDNERRITPRIVDTLVDETLELQEAKRLAITITPEELSKAIDGMAAAPNMPPGTLKPQIEAHGLSVRSFENQIRAQLAWSKVVQRKLRRNVSISQDEVLRAQQSEAAAPGLTEIRLMAIVVPITQNAKEADIRARVEEIGKALQTSDLETVAKRYAGREDIQATPALWVPEDKLMPEVAAAIQSLTPGQVTPPVRTGNLVQFVKLVDKRVTKMPAGATEMLIKQITVNLPATPDKTTRSKREQTEAALRANPGTCDDGVLPKTPLPATAEFARLVMSDIPMEQRAVLARLTVGAVSEPINAPGKLRLVMLCERRDPTGGSGQDVEALRQQLFAEKMELEAQKHLRNLRREASIDLREFE